MYTPHFSAGFPLLEPPVDGVSETEAGFSNWCVVDPASPGPGQRGSFSNKFNTLVAALAAAVSGDVIAITYGAQVGNFDLSGFEDLTIMGLGTDKGVAIVNDPGSGLPTIKVAPVGGVPRRIKINGCVVASTTADPALVVDGTNGPVDNVSVDNIEVDFATVSVSVKYANNVYLGGVENGRVESTNSGLTIQYKAGLVLFQVDPTIGPVQGNGLSLEGGSIQQLSIIGAPQIRTKPGTSIGFINGKGIQSFDLPVPMSLKLQVRGEVFDASLSAPDAGYTLAASASPMVIDFDESTVLGALVIVPLGPVAGRERIGPTARNARFTLSGPSPGSIKVGDKVDLDIRGSFYQQQQLDVIGYPASLTPDHGTINRDWYSPTNWLNITIASDTPHEYKFIPYPDVNQYGVLVTPRTLLNGDFWAITAKTADSVTIEHHNDGGFDQTFDLEFTGRRWAP